MTECGQTMTHLPHWMHSSSSHTGISRAMLRFSHCVVAVGKVPSMGIALTGTSSPSPVRQTTSRDHTMNVRMMQQILAPGVEHTQKADFRSEMFGVGSDLQQSRGAGTEQEIVNDLLVL